MIIQNPDKTIKDAARILSPLKLAILYRIKTIPAVTKAAIVTGRPKGKNQLRPVVIRSIKERAARIVTIRAGTIINVRLYEYIKRVSITHKTNIDTSQSKDHLSPLLIKRSTIVHTAMAENAIIPLSSQRNFLFSFF